MRIMNFFTSHFTTKFDTSKFKASMFEKFQVCLKRVQFYLKFLGLCLLDSKDYNKTIFKRMRSHPLFIVHLISFNSEIITQLLWILEAVISGKSFLEITYLIPCLILCIVSEFKIFIFVCYADHIREFVDTLKCVCHAEEEDNDFKKNLIDERVSMLNDIAKKMISVAAIGVLMFLLGPLIAILLQYYNTGEYKLELPFLAYYPFDEFDIRIYPCIYIHQIGTAIVAILMVYTPNCFFFTCCTFVHIQFLLLQYDMEKIIPEESRQFDPCNFKKLAVRHIELIRCINLLEKIFSKSILFNALTSSIIICVTGFNVLMVTNIVIMASFTAFLNFGLLEIYLYCYYGDILRRSSVEISDAIYNSQWYNIDARYRKSFFFVLLRAQKPCELTAYGFFKINLGAFTSILSKSWSYFALLKTMYDPE